MKYRTIVADPPWQYKKQPGLRGGDGPWPERDYPTMPNSVIAALPVADMADASGAHLYLWTTNVILTRQRWGRPDPIEIAEAWGFTPKTLLTWVKTGPLGMGRFFRGNAEHVVFAVRGDAPIDASRRETNVFVSPRRRHSQKPECFYDLVERVSPGPYLELFARRNRLGWDTWGNECHEHVALTSAPAREDA